MIVAVGDWVLRKGRRGLQALDPNGAWGPVRIAVNVSAQQIPPPQRFVENCLAAATVCNNGGYGLDLEITETGLLHDVEGASRKLRELRTARHASGHRRFRDWIFVAWPLVQNYRSIC